MSWLKGLYMRIFLDVLISNEMGYSEHSFGKVWFGIFLSLFLDTKASTVFWKFMVVCFFFLSEACY